MSDTTLRIQFEGDNSQPTSSSGGSSPRPSNQTRTPSGATPVQTPADEFTYEASAVAGEGASAGMAVFSEAGAAAGGAAGGASMAGGGAAAGAAGGAAAGPVGLLAGLLLAGGGGGGVGSEEGNILSFFDSAGSSIGLISDNTDLLIQGFTSLYDSILAVDDTMNSIVQDIRPFSQFVAAAAAQYQIENTLAMIRRADQIGPETSEYLASRSEINVALADLNTTIVKELMPLVNEGASALANLITVIAGMGRDTVEILQESGIKDFVVRWFKLSHPLLISMKDYLKQIAELYKIGEETKVLSQLDDLFSGRSGFGPGVGPGDVMGGTTTRKGGPMPRRRRIPTMTAPKAFEV